MSNINKAAVLKFYVDTQEYSDRLTAIEAQAASSIATHKTEVAAAIVQVNLIQSQATALTLEVNNLKTNLTDSITSTQSELINRADQLAQDVIDITKQLTEDKAAFTQEIQDALVYLENAESVASALRTPRKINGTDFDGRSDITTNAWGATRTFKIGNKANSINGTSNVDYSLADIGAFPDVGGTIQGNVEVTGNLSVGGTISTTLEGTAARADKLQVARKIQGVDFDGTKDINLPTFTTQTDGLVPKRVGATTTKYLREDGTWVVPTDTTYALLTKASAEDGTATTANTISAQVLKEAIQYHAPTVTNIVGNAGTATKLQTPRTINGVLFDGTQNISLPEAVAYSLPTASDSVLGGIKVGSGLAISNSVLSVGTLNQSTTGNAATATKLQTPRTISLTGNVTGSVSFDGSANVSLTTSITGLGAANGIATLDSNGQVPSTQLPSYVDDVLEYLNVAAFPAEGETGKIYVETVGNTTHRWSGTGYVKITSGEVLSVAGKTGVVTLTKADVGLTNVDNTADSSKGVASAAKLTTARTINGVSFDGTSNITVADSTKAPLESANLIGTPTAPTATTTTNTTQLATTAFVQAVNTADTGSSATTLKLKTARTIGGVSFDGTANINLPGVNTEGNQSTSGNAATATKLQTPRSIAISGAVTGTATSFDGSSDIAIATTAIDGSNISTGTIPAARIPTLNQNTTGNAATASKLATPVQINGVNFDGSQSINIAISGGGGGSTSYADTAGKLANPVQIHGVNFDGTGDINLDVYNKSEVDTAIANATPTTPNATETVAGKAKIATTAIAQAGVNDTDIITALKLKQTLEASKRVLAGSVNFNGTGTVSIRSQLNVSSITDLGIGKYRINMTTSMPNTNYPVFTSVANRSNSVAGAIGLEVKEQTIYSITVSTFVTGTGAAVDVDFISVGWTR